MSTPIPFSFQTDVSLHAFNTFGLQARAAFYACVASENEVVAAVAEARRLQCPVWVLGGGSNVILAQDLSACVLHMRLLGKRLLRTEPDAWIVEAGAGEPWHPLVAWTLEQGWPGLENLAWIPGTVGAAPIQNIGAYGVELSDRLDSVRIYLPREARFDELRAADCQFAYRDSVFKHRLRDAIVVAVRFRLPRPWQPEVAYGDLRQRLGQGAVSAQAICDTVVAVRSSKLPDPARIGNVGSFFKNPIVDQATYLRMQARDPALVAYAQPDGTYKLAAGWVIERCGLKGHRFGPVGVHDRQALVLVNLGQAQGTDVIAAAQAIQAIVQEKFDVTLEVEPVVVRSGEAML